MPGTRRSTANASAAAADNSSAVIAIKQENTRKSTAGSAQSKAGPVEVDTEVAISKSRGNDSDDTIFSVCDSPDCDELDESAGSELGDYELTYLHSIYQPTDLLATHNAHDAILPDGLVPTLTAHGVEHDHDSMVPPSPAPQMKSSMHIAHNEEDDSQPSTPPRAVDAPWASSPEPSPKHSVIPPPSKPAPVVGKTSGRKRKPVAAIDLSPPPPTKRQVSERHAAAVKHEVESDDDGDSECDSRGRPCPMLDGLEIRPEDDPLGLFSRDPSTLTPEEQRLLKKQRRLLKNRESAQLSRHRKKMHLHSLEKHVDALKKDKAALASRVQALQEENERLRKQLMSVV